MLFHVIAARAIHADEVRQTFGAHPGYLFNVDDEKNRREVEMVMLEKPKDVKPPLHRVIFNDRLTKEFQDQYKIRFGQTAAEQAVNSPNRDGDYQFSGQTVSVQDYNRYQRQFGEYMMRRLMEFHIDNWFKNDPQLRPVYDLKDKLSNLNVQIRKSYKLKWKYNLAGPSMEATLDNPYDIYTRVQVLMSGLISSPTNTIVTLAYNFTPRINGSFVYRDKEDLYQLVCSRMMTKRVSMSLTGSTGRIPDNPANIYQNLVLLGLGYSN